MKSPVEIDELIAAGRRAKEDLLNALQVLVLAVRSKALETSLVLCPEPLDDDGGADDQQVLEHEQSQAELFFRSAFESEHPVPRLSEASADFIPVHAVHNRGEATRRATALLGKVIRWRNQNPLHSFRGTGVIHCPGANFDEELAAVAQARKRVRDILVEIHPDRQSRRQLIKATELATLHQVQLGREIKLLRPDCDKVSFCWTGNSMKVDRTTVKGYLRGLRSVSYGDDQPEREEEKNRLVEGLRTLPGDKQIVVLRNAAPAPHSNIRVDGEWIEHRAAVMPFIFTGRAMPDVLQLQDYQRKGQRRSSYWRTAPPLFPGIKTVFEYVETPRAAQRRLRKSEAAGD